MLARLEGQFGSAVEGERSAVETLILTILSQNTTDTNRDRAYAALIDRYGTLDGVAEAPEEEIANVIRVGGLQQQKARSIRSSLDRILAERGSLDLSFLDEMDLDQALGWLIDLPGVGRKTAGIVLLFSFGRPFFPIDTHIRRILTRAGWLDGKGEPHTRVNGYLAPDPQLMYGLHLQLIRLGRTLCKPQRPCCDECPILDRCAHGRGLVG